MLKTQHVVPLLLLTAGCAVRTPATWRLVDQVLVPPGVADASVARRSFTVQRSDARGACPRTDALGMDARKSELKVTVDRAALERQPRGWLAGWAVDAETARCIAPGQGPVFAARVLEAVPLPSAVTYRLMRADDVRAGYVDLGPQNRLEVISPMLLPGAPEDAPLMEEIGATGTDTSLTVTLRTTPNLIGHETAWYGFPLKAGGGSLMTAISAETSIQRQVEPRDAPSKDYFPFSPDTGFYRLFYKADQTAVLTGAPTRAGLPQDLDACGKPGGPVCFTVPKRVGVNPYLVVRVNGKPLAVPAHMPPTVRSVIQVAKLRPEAVLPTLAITKPYSGKETPVDFDRSRPDILGLVLTGHEEIHW